MSQTEKIKKTEKEVISRWYVWDYFGTGSWGKL